MDARREVQRISGISASRATTQTRFLAATRRDGSIWAHFYVARLRHTLGMPSSSRLELCPNRLRRMRDGKPNRLLGTRAMGTRGPTHTGIGMTSDRTRARMVERLRAEGIRDEVVLAAINAVPRHIFVDEALAIRAYD